MSYLPSTSDNGSPSFSRISLSSLPSRKTEAGLLDRPYSRTSTLLGQRGRSGDPDEELTYIPGRSLRDSSAASTFLGGASKLGGGRSPSPSALSTPWISVAPLFASRTSKSRLLPEDEESTQEEVTILPVNNFNRTVDTVQLEQFSDLSIIHQIRNDSQQISRISAKVNSFHSRTPSILHSQKQHQQVPQSSPLPDTSHLDSSQITVVPNLLRGHFSPQQQFQTPPSPTAELPDLDSISRITTVPPPFHYCATSISQKQKKQPPPSPTGEVPYSPGFEKRLVEEADQENAQFKFSTFGHPGASVEDSSFDADNLPSFHFSSPIASSTPRASSKFYGNGGMSSIFDETILSIDLGQDDEDGGDGDATVLPANPVPAPQEEAARPMSRSSMGSCSETDNTDNTMRRRERREQRRVRRKEGILDPIREVSGGSSFVRAQENRQIEGHEERPASQLARPATAVRIQEEAGAEESDDERRGRIWSTLGGRSNLNDVRKRDTSHPWFSKSRVGEAPRDVAVVPINEGNGKPSMTMPQEDPTETLDWLKAADLVTPRALKAGVFTSSHRPGPQQLPEEQKNESIFPSSRNVISPTEGRDKTEQLSPGRMSLFSTSIADIPDPSNAPSTVKKTLPLSYPIPEPEAPKGQPPPTMEEESTADVTKEMEIAGTPVTVVRRSRRNRWASKSPEDIAASESEVRNALRAFSRQASASPSSDRNQNQQALEAEGKGKEKQREESSRMVRGDSNKENTRPWAGAASTTALFQNRYAVAEKLSGVGASRSTYWFGSGRRVADQEEEKEREKEGEREKAKEKEKEKEGEREKAKEKEKEEEKEKEKEKEMENGGEKERGNGGGKGEKQRQREKEKEEEEKKETGAVEKPTSRADRERLRSPTRRKALAGLLSPRKERQVLETVNTGSPKILDGDMESLRPSSRLPWTGNIFGKTAATSKFGSTSTNEAVIAPSGGQLDVNTAQAPAGISARDAAAALQRARASAGSSRAKSPPPRPRTPESRKRKAHLYGDKSVLDSPGSDYDFMEHTRGERGLGDLLSARPAQVTVSVQNTSAALPVPAASSSKASVSLQSKGFLQAAQPGQGAEPGQATQSESSKHSIRITQPTKPSEPVKPVQPVEPVQYKELTQSVGPLPAGAARQPKWSLKEFFFGRSKTQPTQTLDAMPPTQAPQTSAQATQSTQSIQSPSHQSASRATQSTSFTASTRFPLTRRSPGGNNLSSTRASGSATVSNLTSAGKGKERATPIDNPTQNSIHDLLANDKNIHLDLSSFSSSSSEYQVCDPRPPHQRLPRGPGDSEIEADPRFILRLKEAEIAMLSKMSNKLQMLQLELRSTKRGIEILEKKLVGSDSEKSSTTGTEVDNTCIVDEPVTEWTAEERKALRHALQELEALEARRVGEVRIEADRGRGAEGVGNGWSTKQKVALTIGLLAMTGLTCLLLEVLLLLVAVRVPCRIDTEFTDSVCNLRNLPGWDTMLPVNVGEGLELLPLESPLLGLAGRILKFPAGLVEGGMKKLEGLAGVPAWISGGIGWVGRGIWGLIMTGLGSIWELLVVVMTGLWEIIKAWGVLAASVALWMWKIVWTVLSTLWAILTWGTTFTQTTANGTTPGSVLTSTIVSPSVPSRSWIGGSTMDDDAVTTIVANAGEETSVPFVEEEKWWLDYQAEMRIQREKNGENNRDRDAGHAEDEVGEHAQEEPWK